MCEEELSIGSLRKGSVIWPDTAVGRHRSVRCPYAYTESAFVGRDCLLVDDVYNSSAARWSSWSSKDMDVCPDAPFTRHVHQLYRQLVIDHFM